MSEPKYATLAVHAGQHPDPLTGAVNVPVYLSSTFELTGIGTDKGYDYSRAGNPTRDRLETALAALEGGTCWPRICQWHGGHLCAGGDAACGRPRDCFANVYGGTTRLFNMIVSALRDRDRVCGHGDLDAVKAAIKPNTKLMHIETPTNPLMVLTDIAAVCEIAHAHGVEVSVDNTFMSPALQSPLALGADVVMHSTTKYLEWPLGWVGRRADRIEAGAQGAVSAGAEGGGRNHVAVRVLPGAARHQDAAAAHEAARGEWPRGGGVSVDAAEGDAAGVSGIEEPSAA